MKSRLFCFTLILSILCACSGPVATTPPAASFNDGWRFLRNDTFDGQDPSIDDSHWRLVNLPHDYSIEDLPDNTPGKIVGPFSELAAGDAATGHTVGGIAWYRKHFTLDPDDKGKTIQILFDGVYMNSDCWINGHHLGNHPYGYTAFAYDLTPFLKPAGQDNVLAVEVKNLGRNSRWYSGSGIYRKVTLIKTNAAHFELWGIQITSTDVSNEQATVQVATAIVNKSKQALAIKTTILSPEGKEVGTVQADGIDPDNFRSQLKIAGPELWSLDKPALYTAKVQLLDGSTVVDEAQQKFGIRTIAFSPEKGFQLNGQSVLLHGACMHHDNGPLGSAAFKTAEVRRVAIMKANGFNAIRTAHNPPSTFFLDASDSLGMLVLDEAFDQWERGKNDNDYHLYFDDWWERDIEAMVMRDRNHPSVIIWSIGNEINERADSSGLAIAKKLKDKILTMDTTRPITQAICHFWDHPGRPWSDTAPAFAQMDVDGYNYRWSDYVSDHKQYPNRIIMGTETFPMEALNNWELAETESYVIGDFVWTGWDYLGESGIGHTRLDTAKDNFLPGGSWFNAYCGDISILGYKKPQMYFRDVVWRNSPLEILVHAPVPEGRKEVVSAWGWPEEWKSWNWEGNEGKPLQVSVYTRCDQIRLELNGKVIGTKKVIQHPDLKPDPDAKSMEIKALVARFEVPYQSGELVAIGLKDGREVARQTLKTAGSPTSLKVTAERDTVRANGNDLAYFNIEVVDAEGQLIPNAVLPVTFDVTGSGTLQAVANGNPKDMKSFQSHHVNTFRGRCQVIVRATHDKGAIKAIARSEGLNSGHAEVSVE